MKIKLLIFCLLAIFYSHSGCGVKSKTDRDGSRSDSTALLTRADSAVYIEKTIFPIYIDKTRDYESKIISIQEGLGDVDYIKLETNENCLLPQSTRIKDVCFTNDDIFIGAWGNIIIRFDKNGNFRNVIGHTGPGPKEILNFTDFWVDTVKQSVFILDSSPDCLKVFDFEGLYQKTVPLKNYCGGIGLIDDSIALFTTFLAGNEPTAFLSSLNTGEMINEIRPVCTQETGVKVISWDKYISSKQLNNKIIHQGFYTDTIFTIDIDKQAATPRYIQLPVNTGKGGENSNPFVIFETDRYSYLTIYRESRLPHCFLVDKKDNTIYQGFVCDYNLQRSITPINSNIDNVIVDIYDTYMLKDLLSKNRLRGKLKEVAETLDDDDNPVLMIAKINF